MDWLNRYERVGRYNHWGDNELRENFEMSLDGAALKWYSCLETAGTIPQGWQDAAGNLASGAAGPIVPGLRTRFLSQFQPGDYTRFQERKLRQRKQGREEAMSDYFYDVLDLCRVVYPQMSEKQKLDHLYRGLKPSLMERLWMFKPATCDEFLVEAKRYQEATFMSDQREWALAMMGE